MPMRDYKRNELYPHTKTLSSTEVIDYAKNPSKFYFDWVMTSGEGKKITPALAFGLGFAELYADRSFDYVPYLQEHKVSKRLIAHMGYVIDMFPELPEGCAEYELIV